MNPSSIYPCGRINRRGFLTQAGGNAGFDVFGNFGESGAGIGTGKAKAGSLM
jgi:hypothetical protein